MTPLIVSTFNQVLSQLGGLGAFETSFERGPGGTEHTLRVSHDAAFGDFHVWWPQGTCEWTVCWTHGPGVVEIHHAEWEDAASLEGVARVFVEEVRLAVRTV